MGSILYLPEYWAADPHGKQSAHLPEWGISEKETAPEMCSGPGMAGSS